MLTFMLDRHVFYYIIGLVGLLGISSKLIVHSTLKGLVRAASDMNKSEHLLMKLVRQKFEHACMVSDKVQNVGAFVDKYMYEYRVMKLRLHGWRQIEKITIWFCLLAGALGSALSFVHGGMSAAVLRYGAAGAFAAIILFLLYVAEDENYQLEAAKTYMVDFLENVYARRYEKMYLNQKGPEVMMPHVGNEEIQETVIEIQEAKEMETKEPVPAASPESQTEQPRDEASELKQIEIISEKEAEYPNSEIIREILEEFLA